MCVIRGQMCEVAFLCLKELRFREVVFCIVIKLVRGGQGFRPTAYPCAVSSVPLLAALSQ